MINVHRVKRILVVLIVIVSMGAVFQQVYAQEGADETANTAAGEANAPAAETHQQGAAEQADSGGSGLLFIAAALCVGFSSLAAGWAVSTVGAAAMGAISEKPELAGRALIFVGLAEGIAIYGLIVAIMILGQA